MVALEKHSSQITKIYCLEHKLAIFENFIHTFEPFKTIDTKINAINSWFNYRDGKYNLELKPLKTFSTTRPWRSHLQNYTIFCRNFTSYIDIAMTDRTFPEIHPLNEVKQILEFESIYCQNFDKLEAVDSDLNTALICYINIIYLFETNELALRLKLTNKFISNIAEYILSPVACAFYVLHYKTYSFSQRRFLCPLPFSSLQRRILSQFQIRFLSPKFFVSTKTKLKLQFLVCISFLNLSLHIN